MERDAVKGKKIRDRWILGIFFLFLLAVATENQIYMPRQVEAYQNDAYIFHLRETLRKEFIAFSYGIPGALDVRGRNKGVQLREIMKRQSLPLPEKLFLSDGPAGKGKLTGLGHPFLGGKPERTTWQLVLGAPGGSLELEAVPATHPT